MIEPTDDMGCTLLPPPAISTCYCTRRAGCQSPPPEDECCPHCLSKSCAGDCDEEYGDEEDGPR